MLSLSSRLQEVTEFAKEKEAREGELEGRLRRMGGSVSLAREVDIQTYTSASIHTPTHTERETAESNFKFIMAYLFYCVVLKFQLN